jgi:hypothetical protein
MKVTEITEHEDGSATLSLELNSEEVRLLIQDSLLRAIKESIEQEKDK